MKQFWNGWSYPKMMPEIIEAVETHFCDDKDIIVDCMLYLKSRLPFQWIVVMQH